MITTNHEHISALAPLYQLRERHGVVIRFADLGPVADHPAREAIAQQITEHTRLIVLSHVTWTTGALIDIKSVAALGRERGIPVLVDGAQSAGAIPIDVKELGVDFYAIPMQKWLCGPDGTGGLYVRRKSMEYVTPTHVGYFSIKHEEDVEFALHEFAQRFELVVARQPRSPVKALDCNGYTKPSDWSGSTTVSHHCIAMPATRSKRSLA